MKTIKKWTLDPAEVTWTGSAASSKSGKSASKRHFQKLTLTHVPTGVTVSGATEDGDYTRKQMAQMGASLWADLYRQLAQKVAAALRIRAR